MKVHLLAAAICFAAAGPAHASGYMTIPDIAGESRDRGHEGEIDIDTVSYAVSAPKAAGAGSGRMRMRATPGDFTVVKKADAASPYIALAAFQQKAFDEIEIVMTRPGSSGADRQYFTITLSNVRISSVENMISEDGASSEAVGFSYGAIKINAVSRAGDEHEVEYDVAAGQ